MKPFYIHTGGMKKEIAIEIIIKLLNKKPVKKILARKAEIEKKKTKKKKRG